MWRLFSRATRQPGTGRSRTNSFRPRLETLEDRCCPSGGALQWSEVLPSSAIYTPWATTVQPDGKIVTAGQYGFGIGVTRLNPNGTLDTSFNGTGTASIRVNKSDVEVGTAVAIQPNGQIVVGGSGGVGAIVARFNADGSLDTHFGKKGYFLYSGPNPGVNGVAILPNSDILVGGTQATATGAATKEFLAFELTSTGALNTAFGSSGVAAVQVGSGDGASSMAVVPGTGQLVLAGYATQQAVNYGCLVMLTAGGQLDPSFHGTGTLIATNSPLPGFTGVAVQGSATSGYAILVTGYIPNSSTSPSFSSVTRYTLTGAVDTSFGGTGTGSFTLTGNSSDHSWFQSLALESDGSIVLGGRHSYLGSDGKWHTEFMVGHLSADGILDTSFGPNGNGFSYAQVDANDIVRSLAIDPLTGDIILGGFSTTGGGLGALARFSHP